MAEQQPALNAEQCEAISRALAARKQDIAAELARFERAAPLLAFDAEVGRDDNARARLAGMQKERARLRDEAERVDWAIDETRARSSRYGPRDVAREQCDTRLHRLKAEAVDLRYLLKGGTPHDRIDQAVLDRFAAVITERRALAGALLAVTHNRERYGGELELTAEDLLAGSPTLIGRLPRPASTSYEWRRLIDVLHGRTGDPTIEESRA